MDHIYYSIAGLVEECKNELDLDRKIEILYTINSLLPESQRVKIPSLITNDYVNLALSRIEENLLVA